MRQSSLFERTSNMVCVPFYPDFDGWRSPARRCLNDQLPPNSIWWQEDDRAPVTTDTTQTSEVRIPKSYFVLARSVACHQKDDRWALLYRLLWRLTHQEPHLMEMTADADIAKARRYAQAVHRDVHKMKAFVRFSRVPLENEDRFVAWFEPEHHIVPTVAEFFRRRYTNMCWSVLTPDQCAHWDGKGKMQISSGLDHSQVPQGDEFVDAWQLYYRNIFNPARPKKSAMQSEMPQKYWRHLPEAHLIPELLNAANERTVRMTEKIKLRDELQCGPRPPPPDQQHQQQAHNNIFAQLRAAAALCRGCTLWQDATQTVFGEGPGNAELMLVGEQPGDREDLTGRPFQGPAGEVLDTALQSAGINRDTVYVTNAVKHFKHRVQRKVRLHDKPNTAEIRACGDWLNQEIQLIQPKLIVCLGATAIRAITGQDLSIREFRGRLHHFAGHNILVTYHPAHALRSGTSGAQIRRAIQADLSLACGQLAHLEATH